MMKTARRDRKAPRALALLAMLLVFTAAFAVSPALAKKNTKYASLVMDAETGLILHERHADKSLHPASLTKMMTLLMVFEALDAKAISKRTRIRVSRHAASMVPSKIGIPAGGSIRVEDAIYALVTKSANDVAAAVAEHLGGTESKFARLMTIRARDIGMTRTTFRNASGLHHPRQVSTARDMARLARYMLLRYPHHYHYFSTRQFTYKGKTYNNHNRLMRSYSGMDGFKTGYINASGFNLVASAKRSGKRIIGVVFGGRTTKSRNAHMADILNSGFQKVDRARIAHARNVPKPAPKPALAMAVASAPTLSAQERVPYASIAALQQNKEQRTQMNNLVTAKQMEQVRANVESGIFDELIGEGDFDISSSKRLETGLLAMAVHTGKFKPSPDAPSPAAKKLRDAGHAVIARLSAMPEETKTQKVALTPAVKDDNWKKIYSGNRWSIQIGAFTSRAATDVALSRAMEDISKEIAGARPLSVPLRTDKGLVFRARLTNLSKEDAVRACRVFKDCITIAPDNER